MTRREEPSRHSSRKQWECLDEEKAYRVSIQGNHTSHLKILFVIGNVVGADARAFVISVQIVEG